jgi:hypothetical protein
MTTKKSTPKKVKKGQTLRKTKKLEATKPLTVSLNYSKIEY